MYKVNPIVDFSQVQVPLPTCMYAVPPIDGEQDTSPEAQLKTRQLALLDGIALLSKRVDKLLADKGAPARALDKHGQLRPDSSQARKPPGECEVVVNAPPEVPPLATAATAFALTQRGVTLESQQFWHSTMKSPPPTAFLNEHRYRRGHTQCKVRLTVVWRPVDQPSTMVSVSNHGRLQGDSNGARFLCRQFAPELYPEQDALQTAVIDDMIDLANSLRGSRSKDVKLAVKAINMKLGKNKFLAGPSMTLADITMWSAIKQFVSTSFGKSSNITPWFAAMEANAACVSAVNALKAVAKLG